MSGEKKGKGKAKLINDEKGQAAMIMAMILMLGGVIVIGAMVNFVTSDLPRLQNSTPHTKTGYVEDVEILEGGFGIPSQTLIRFSDGYCVALQQRKTEIPIKHNVTLHYHDNGYGLYFLDNFIVLEEGGKYE